MSFGVEYLFADILAVLFQFPHICKALHQQIFKPDTAVDNTGQIGTRFRSCIMVSPASFKKGLKKLFSEGLDKHLGEKLSLASLLNRFLVVQ